MSPLSPYPPSSYTNRMGQSREQVSLASSLTNLDPLVHLQIHLHHSVSNVILLILQVLQVLQRLSVAKKHRNQYPFSLQKKKKKKAYGLMASRPFHRPMIQWLAVMIMLVDMQRRWWNSRLYLHRSRTY
jgi:hypothetical protein